MNKIEKRVRKSFELVKHDMNGMWNFIQQVKKTQEVLHDRIRTLELRNQELEKKLEGHKFVASREGKKYHNENCPFAQNIKPKMALEFETVESARNQGYKACDCAKA